MPAGAARLQTLVRGLGIKIVLIEEAAEVLEAHVLACLVPSVEQLILVGGAQVYFQCLMSVFSLLVMQLRSSSCCSSACAAKGAPNLQMPQA